MFPTAYFNQFYYQQTYFPRRPTPPVWAPTNLVWSGGITLLLSENDTGIGTLIEWDTDITLLVSWPSITVSCGCAVSEDAIMTGVTWGVESDVVLDVTWGDTTDYCNTIIQEIQSVSPIVDLLRWTGYGHYGSVDGRKAKVVEKKDPVRRMNPINVRYTYVDRITGAVIDLTGFTTCKLVIKRKGDTYVVEDAEFDGAKTLGKVRCLSLSFTTAGLWDAQFVCFNSAITEEGALWGNPVRFEVLDNLNDLDADERAE